MAGGKGRRQVWLFLCSIGVALLGILMTLLSGTVLRNWIIIEFSIRSLKLAYIAGGVVTIGGLGSGIVNSVPLIKAKSLQRREWELELAQQRRRTQVITDFAENSTPENTRKRLEQLKEEAPKLEYLIARCLSQMDVMDLLQEKQGSLIRTNDALYLKDTVAVLDNVEGRICRNFRNIINLCIAADSPDNLDIEKVDWYLEDNEHKLTDSKELLKASADWINQYDMDGAKGDRSEVENWIKVIRDSLREDKE